MAVPQFIQAAEAFLSLGSSYRPNTYPVSGLGLGTRGMRGTEDLGRRVTAQRRARSPQVAEQDTLTVGRGGPGVWP